MIPAPLRRATSAMPPWSMAVVAMLSVQFSNALSVPVIEHVGASGTAWLRMCFGTLFLWLIARPALRTIRKKDVPALIALGAVTGFMMVFFLSALEHIELGTAVAIDFLGPLTVAGLMSPRKRALVWPVLALCGVVLLAEPWHGQLSFVGVGFAAASGACWGLYNLLTQKVGDRFSGISGLSLTIPVAAVLTLPFGLPEVIAGDVTWWVLPAAAGIALITPVIAFGFEMLALRRMTHTAFGTLLSIEPSFGVLMGLIVLGQTPAPLQIIGVAIVITAGAAAQRGGRRGPREVIVAEAADPPVATDPTASTDPTPEQSQESP